MELNHTLEALMQNNDYLSPALAAFILALIFPAYWIYVVVGGGASMPEAYYANVLKFDISDWVYLALGALEIYVYLSLKRVLHDRLNFRSIDILIFLIVFNTAIFHGQFFADLSIYLAGDKIGIDTRELILDISYFMTIAGIFAYGVISFLIGAVLLYKFQNLPNLLKYFAVMTLILGGFQLTLVFGPASILLFPISLLILAFYFIQKPEMIEVV
jgi:hypothetical protein